MAGTTQKRRLARREALAGRSVPVVANPVEPHHQSKGGRMLDCSQISIGGVGNGWFKKKKLELEYEGTISVLPPLGEGARRGSGRR